MATHSIIFVNLSFFFPILNICRGFFTRLINVRQKSAKKKKNRIKYERNKYSCKKNSLEIFIWDIYIYIDKKI